MVKGLAIDFLVHFGLAMTSGYSGAGGYETDADSNRPFDLVIGIWYASVDLANNDGRAVPVTVTMSVLSENVWATVAAIYLHIDGPVISIRFVYNSSCGANYSVIDGWLVSVIWTMAMEIAANGHPFAVIVCRCFPIQMRHYAVRVEHSKQEERTSLERMHIR